MPPLTDPWNVPDSFASGFDLYDGDDWLRLIGWAECAWSGTDGAVHEERRRTVSVVIPRSCAAGLARTLRQSTAHSLEARKH